MNRRYLTALSGVLYTICALCAVSTLGCLFGLIKAAHTVNVLLVLLALLSGYFASLFVCARAEEEDRKKAIMCKTVLAAFLLYLVVLIDFTLIDGGFGRNIFNILGWNDQSFSQYLKTNTNLIPFQTIHLFISGYRNGYLPLIAMLENIFGNLLAFTPFAFFLPALFPKMRRGRALFLAVLCVVVAVELLQFIFLTGSTDLDDVILNTLGAMLAFRFFTLGRVSGWLTKATFGVWNYQKKKGGEKDG